MSSPYDGLTCPGGGQLGTHASRQTADIEIGCAQQTLLQITEVPETQEESISIGVEAPGHGLSCSAQGYSHRVTASGAWAEGWEQSF